MSSSNRTRVTSVKEVTVGTTPNSPRMRTRRLTGESLKWTPTFDNSDELRDDGMNPPPIQTGEDSNGDINFELSYPYPDSPQATDIESAFHNNFVNTPVRDNDGTPDSIITQVTGSTGVIAVTTGPAFVVGHLIRNTGFGQAGNNGLFPITTGSATVPAVGAGKLTDEAAPPANARVKVVGFAGTSGDITALADGLGSTTLDFTTLGIVKGQWVKIGDLVDANTFAFLVTAGATARLAAWARVSDDPTAHKLPLDNLPTGWTTDVGTGKTIRVFFGDQVKNGVTQIGQTIERGAMGQAAPTYILQPGMVARAYSLTIEAKKKITGTISYLGMTAGGTRAGQSTTSVDASPDPATNLTKFPVMAASANIGRIGENGAAVVGPNFVKGLTINLANPLTEIDSVDAVGAVGIGSHSRNVTGQLNTYFGDNTLLQRFFAGGVTSVNGRIVKNNMAVVIQLPAITYDKDGSPNASGKDQDMMLPLGFTASKDEVVTQAMIVLDRLEYVE